MKCKSKFGNLLKKFSADCEIYTKCPPAPRFFPRSRRAENGHFGEVLANEPHRITVVTVVVVHVGVARIEVEVPRVVRIVRIGRTRPVVAVVAHIVDRSPVAVARSG